MKHRDSAAGQGDPGDRQTPMPDVRPDYTRSGLEDPERMAEMMEDPEPNFATKDIDPAEMDPIPPGTPSYATSNIDPAEPDPVPTSKINYSTKDQKLG